MIEDWIVPSHWPAVVRELLGERLAADAAGSGRPDRSRRSCLAALTAAQVCVAPHPNADAVPATLAGLWLYFDFFDESHEISQSLLTSTGSYWHGILHRREPDAFNAKYWFRRVGPHPVFSDLQNRGAGTRLGGLGPKPLRGPL